MHLVVDDNFSVIMTDGAEDLIIGACDLYRIEGKN